MTVFYLGHAGWIGGILLVTAFIFTFWAQPPCRCLAAGFYTAGSLVGIGFKVYLLLLSLWLAFALNDGSPTNFVWTGLVLSIAASVYGITSVVLLWPWISHKNAMRFGKCLHLIFFPVFFSMLLICAFLTRGRGPLMPDLQWLVYGPLWFRIRERFATKDLST